MPIQIFNNVPSVTIQRALRLNNNRLGRSAERIVSGLRGNKSADDYASFQITQFLLSDTPVLKQAGKNMNSTISLIDLAEAALKETYSILIRLKELATKAATGIISVSNRNFLQFKFKNLKEKIDQIASKVAFNSKKLLDGSLASSASDPNVVILGLDSTSPNLINPNSQINLTDTSTQGLRINASSISTRSVVLLAIRDLRNAFNNLSTIRNRVGSTQARLAQAVNNRNISIQYLTQAESTIRGADLAKSLQS